MNRADFRLLERLRVRWAEVDMQHIVFNGHYLMYFDTAVAAWWRAMVLPYHDTMQSLGGDLYVRKATLQYDGSAGYDDLIDVGVACEHIGNSSLRLRAAVFRGEQRLVHGELVYVFADPATRSALRVPEALREVFAAWQGGSPMVQVEVGDWAALGSAARPIRDAVFIREQGIAAELEHDAADATAIHAIARNRLGVAVGTGRLLAQGSGVAKIGRMAVLAAVRGAGVGAALLEALVGVARARGEREVEVHAQASAVAFYQRAGFAPQGAPFDEAGIAHQAMTRRFS